MTNTTNTTGNEGADTVLEELLEALESDDLTEVEEKMDAIREHLIESPELIKWITEPVNITHLHETLIENFEVPARSMQLRHRVPNRSRRAVLFVQAMLNGIRRTKEA